MSIFRAAARALTSGPAGSFFARDINTMTVMGNITRDVVVRDLPSGGRVANITVVTNLRRYHPPQQGQT
jgi:single-stranded DNA-binding protein